MSRLALIVLLTIFVLSSCGRFPSPPSEGLTVFVSVAPQKYFVRRIAGDLVNVEVMVEPGSDPHTYEPRPAQMASLESASAYFTVGVPFEDAWMGRITAANPSLRIVDTALGVRRVARGNDLEHDSGEGAPDPHIWLSPSLVKIQARNICAALEEMDPEHSVTYGANLVAFEDQLDSLGREIRASLEQSGQTGFLVFHPAWGYFADEFGLEMIVVERGGQEPSPSELAETVTLARSRGIRVVFAQPEFSPDAPEAVAREIGGTVVTVSPLAEDWPGAMRTIAEAISQEASGE
jgi:zinc transport system substrate-binding protein